MQDIQISDEEKNQIGQIIVELAEAMGFTASVEAEDTVTKGLVFNLDLGRDSFLLIGKRGTNLHAFEVLAQAMVNRAMQGKFIRFSVDVDDYKRKREWYLKETVKQALERAKQTGRPVALLPMPNYERRIVHSLVQALEPKALSSSTGYEPRRRVVIKIG